MLGVSESKTGFLAHKYRSCPDSCRDQDDTIVLIAPNGKEISKDSQDLTY
jgi:hypothetical protein